MTHRTVELRAEGVLLELLERGAAVRRLVVDGTDIALGHGDPDCYRTNPDYLGSTIGRYANRIAGARFPLDGHEYEIAANEAGNALHGGTVGFDARDWTLDAASDTSATFSLVSADGDQGFPGELAATVTYTVSPGSVRIDYVATTDRPTVVNLTNHTYFNLDGEGSGTVDDHTLSVAARAFTPGGPDLVPTGEVRDVTGTPFDLRTATRLGDVLAHDDEQLRHGGGLDHNFVVDGSGMRPVARLSAGGRSLVVESDQPGVQVYTGVHFDHTIVGPSGAAYGPRAGIALETQGFPDAPHHAGFPSTVLRPGQTYRTSTIWRVTG